MAKKTKKSTKPTTATAGAIPIAIGGTGQTTATADAPPKSARELTEEGLGRIEDALEQLQLGLYMLQDGRAVLKELPLAEQAQRAKGIQDFGKKSDFALQSLIDEVKLLLGRAAMGVKLSAFAIPVDLGETPKALQGIATDDLKKQHQLYRLAAQIVGQHEASVVQSPMLHETYVFLATMADGVQLAVARKEQT